MSNGAALNSAVLEQLWFISENYLGGSQVTPSLDLLCERPDIVARYICDPF